MLLNWARNRMTGPRFLPSGKRLGPYFCRRLAASVVSRPFPVSMVSRFAASSADIACQATSLAAFAFAAVPMLVLRSLADRELTSSLEVQTQRDFYTTANALTLQILTHHSH